MADKIQPPTPAEQADHARSVRDYPQLDFAEDEYVVIDVERTKVGLFFIWFVTIALFALFLAFGLLSFFTDKMYGGAVMSLVCMLCAVFSLAGGAIGRWIYKHNNLIVSNQRAFQRVQVTPFSYRQQSLELENVEDVSFNQAGILPMAFNYGTIRLSTVGDEHTYRFTFVNNPQVQSKMVKDTVHMVKKSMMAIVKARK